MSPRGLLVVCVALLALQGSSAFSLSESLHNFWNKVEDTTHRVFNKVETSVEQARDAVAGTAKEVEQKVEQKVSSLISTVKSKINEWRHKGEEQNVDLSPCVAAADNATEGLVGSISQNIMNCVTDEVKDGEQIIYGLFDLADKVNSIYSNAQTALEQCNLIADSYERYTCSSKATQEASSKETAIVREVLGLILQSRSFATNFHAAVTTCENKLIEQVPTFVSQIDDDFKTCLENAGVTVA